MKWRCQWWILAWHCVPWCFQLLCVKNENSDREQDNAFQSKRNYWFNHYVLNQYSHNVSLFSCICRNVYFLYEWDFFFFINIPNEPHTSKDVIYYSMHFIVCLAINLPITVTAVYDCNKTSTNYFWVMLYFTKLLAQTFLIIRRTYWKLYERCNNKLRT